MSNTFSAMWFATFLDSIPATDTAREVSFIEQHLPIATHPRLLDICCGSGRHAIPLAGRGYSVLGVDRDADAVAKARAAAGERSVARFMRGDMQRLSEINEAFDGAINMWQSFGYGSDNENLAIMQSVAARLRAGGRCIFDIYNREHIATFPETEVSERGGRRISTTRSWNGARHKVSVRYDGAPTADESEWRLYSPSEFQVLASEAGFHTRLACAWFDETTPPSAAHGRMQFVLERPGAVDH